jgi:hypothetical protein
MPTKTVKLVPKIDRGNAGEPNPVWTKVGGIDAAQLLDDPVSAHDGDATYIEAANDTQLIVLEFELPSDLKRSIMIEAVVVEKRADSSDSLIMTINKGDGMNGIPLAISVEPFGSYGSAIFSSFTTNPITAPAAFFVEKDDVVQIAMVPTSVVASLRVTALELNITYDSSTAWSKEPIATGSWDATEASDGDWFPQQAPGGTWTKS